MIHLLQHRNIPGLLWLDIYKAFDSLSWVYLHYVLEQWGFGESILQWIFTLYSSPTQVSPSLASSLPPFRFTEGPGKVAPIPDFISFIVIAFRKDPNISGIQCAGTHHKVSLFADDALLTMTNPLMTLPNLQILLSHFSALQSPGQPSQGRCFEHFLAILYGVPATSLLSVSLEVLLPGLSWNQIDPFLLHQLLCSIMITYILNAILAVALFILDRPHSCGQDDYPP